MSNLHSYLKSTGQTQTQFAPKVGISRNYLSELLRGLRSPSLKLAFAIEDETNGAVPARSFLENEVQGGGMSHVATQKSSETKGEANGRV